MVTGYRSLRLGTREDLHLLLVPSQLLVRVAQMRLTSAGVAETAHAEYYATTVGQVFYLKIVGYTVEETAENNILDYEWSEEAYGFYSVLKFFILNHFFG